MDKIARIDISNKDYLNNLKKYNFTSPWEWYRHIVYGKQSQWINSDNNQAQDVLKLKGLPVLQVDSYRQIDKKLLEKSVNEIKKS